MRKILLILSLVFCASGALAQTVPQTGVSLYGTPIPLLSGQTLVGNVNNFAAGSASPTFGGALNTPGIISGGTKFTTSGCSVSSTTGGATAGTLTLGANTCTVVVTMNGATGLTAPNGWTCQAHDKTSITAIIDGESSSTQTTASIVIPVTAGATDVISFSCVGY